MGHVSGCWLFLYPILLCQQKYLCHKDVDTSQTWDTLRASWANPELCHQGVDRIVDTIRRVCRGCSGIVSPPCWQNCWHKSGDGYQGLCQRILLTKLGPVTEGVTVVSPSQTANLGLCHRLCCVTGGCGETFWNFVKNPYIPLYPLLPCRNNSYYPQHCWHNPFRA